MGDLAVTAPGGDASDYDIIAKEAIKGAEEGKTDDSSDGKGDEEGKEEDRDLEAKEEGKGDDKVEAKGEEDEEEDKKIDAKGDELTSRSRPTTKEIAVKYPDFFKDFPDLRHAFFREQEFTGIFPTIEDAQDAKTRSEDFDTFSDLVNSGDVVGFLGVLDETDRDTAKKFALNFLPAVYKNNADLYYSITTPLVENFVVRLHKHGEQSNDDNIKNAALQASLWAFGDTSIATGKKTVSSASASAPASAEKTDFEKEKTDFYAERFATFRSDVTTGADRQFRTIVLKDFDPNKVFNAELRTILVDRILDEVDTALKDDKGHMDRMQSIWKRADRAGYAGNWKSRITTAYLERAKTIMPAIRQRIVKAVIASKQDESDRLAERGERGADRKEVVGSHSPSGGKTGTPTAKEVDWDRTSDADFLDGKITTKK